MPIAPNTGIIAHAIRLSVAPVFLVTGVAAPLGVMTTRLARIIDSARSLENTSGLAAKARAAARVTMDCPIRMRVKREMLAAANSDSFDSQCDAFC